LGKKCGPWSVTKFTKILPSDLFFYPTQPTIKLDRQIIKTNILSKFDEDWTKNVAPRV